MYAGFHSRLTLNTQITLLCDAVARAYMTTQFTLRMIAELRCGRFEASTDLSVGAMATGSAESLSLSCASSNRRPAAQVDVFGYADLDCVMSGQPCCVAAMNRKTALHWYGLPNK